MCSRLGRPIVPRGRAQYEPELFPGLVYRMLVPKVVLLIFVSGKIVLTGAKVQFAALMSCGVTERILAEAHGGLALTLF